MMLIKRSILLVKLNYFPKQNVEYLFDVIGITAFYCNIDLLFIVSCIDDIF